MRCELALSKPKAVRMARFRSSLAFCKIAAASFRSMFSFYKIATARWCSVFALYNHQRLVFVLSMDCYSSIQGCTTRMFLLGLPRVSISSTSYATLTTRSTDALNEPNGDTNGYINGWGSFFIGTRYSLASTGFTLHH